MGEGDGAVLPDLLAFLDFFPSVISSFFLPKIRGAAPPGPSARSSTEDLVNEREGRHGGIMVTALDFGSSGPSSSPSLGN